MPNYRNSLKSPRAKAYLNQEGKCFYCDFPMWLEQPEAFAKQYEVSLNQANALKCTGEHLLAKSHSGKDNGKNIVAACWFCNSRRHRRKNPLEPKEFKRYVTNRIRAGRWISVRPKG